MTEPRTVTPTSTAFGLRAMNLTDPTIGISPAVTRLECDVRDFPAQADRIVGKFLADLTGPLVEVGPTPGTHLVTFVYVDASAYEVLVTINRITHQYSHSLMNRIAGTNVWARTFVLGTEWRGSYSFLPVSMERAQELRATEARFVMHAVRTTGVPDKFVTAGDLVRSSAGMSVCALPQAPADDTLRRLKPTVGTVVEREAPQNRRVWVYENGKAADQNRPCLILLDGETWHAEGFVPVIVENLLAAGKIERAPLVVMLDAEGKRRMTDLSIDGTASDYVAGELLAWVRKEYSVSGQARDVIVAGQSLGGLTSLKTLCDHPQVVGRAIALSASLWQDSLLERSQALTGVDVDAYIAAGIHEPTIVEPNLELAQQWMDRGIPHKHVQYDGGHDLACWRIELARGLQYLL